MEQSRMNGAATSTLLSVILLFAASAAAQPVERDPGIEIRVDRARFEASVIDLAAGESAAPFQVVLGSPGQQTPSGAFPIEWVVLRPAWNPGRLAARVGASPVPPSLDGPMGAAKIPFADGGLVALHGGGDPQLIGKPVSSGCVRASDADLLRAIAWLHLRGALASPEPREGGETYRRFQRPARLIVD